MCVCVRERERERNSTFITVEDVDPNIVSQALGREHPNSAII